MSQSSPKNIAIVGAGIAGLAAAIRLAAKGHKVQVFEANAQPGGKISELHQSGFRWDIGPTVITWPELVDELFALHGKNPRDYFEYEMLEEPFHYFFPDGTKINAHANVQKFAEEVAAKTTDSAEQFLKALKDAEEKFNITRPVFIESSIHRLKDFFTKDVAKGIGQFYKINAFTSMNKRNAALFSDDKLVRIFNNYATYVGSNPFVAPATLNVIQHLEINRGLALPKGGIYSMVRAVFALAKEVGVLFHFNQKVDEILVENGRAKGIRIEQKTLAFDAVVSNMDVYFTYKKLLPNQAQPQRILRQKKSSSAIAFYWGMDKTIDEMGVHNMFFTADQKAEYRAIFKEKNLCSDPTIYVCVTSKKVNDDAPAGCENWFVLITAPNLKDRSGSLVAEARKIAIKKLGAMLGQAIEPHIKVENHLDPSLIEQNYSSAFGSIYGNSSNGKFAAFLRHANFSRSIGGLYFVGGSVHPGAGIPMCLNSAKILAQVFE